ncbi:MAG TPA: glycoside hydrolase family 2 TIM barrel-domain containing protein [Verrucomicrobiae bacterium]|nr:glycoside hydrolase family 2 TIM barrel-domain containing protein [Verrucomicrobiae bacterium]
MNRGGTTDRFAGGQCVAWLWGAFAGLGLSAVAAAPAPIARLETRWAATVTATNVHAEYPRPQFVRTAWQNLNGLWDYAITPTNAAVPAAYDGKILVPFPVESLLSRVERRLDEHSTLWYRRKFTVPAAWRGQRILLHFGAVDWQTTVFLNGAKIGSHQGGYDAFSFDLTPRLSWGRENELVVMVYDPTEGDQPRGKQSRRPEGIFYSPSSGIWQTVWLEPVPPTHLISARLTPDVAVGAIRVLPLANDLDSNATVGVAVHFAGKPVAQVDVPVGRETPVALGPLHLWSPEDPQLYDVTFTLQRGAQVLDQVDSYFGMRDIQVATDGKGARRLMLNGQPLFQMGVLDQGFWPDGLYTAPSDDALRHDLETAKKLGLNLVRKHVKVEPERWYYWADRLGLLVWQDMPSGNNATEEGRRSFRMELERMLAQRANHPSIVMWVLFNEGWGQFDTERLVRWIKAVDPLRLVDNASGWTDAKVGDVVDMHSYPEPAAPPMEGVRASVLGEFGGLGLGVDGHTWSDQTWGYQGLPDSEKLTSRYVALLDKVHTLEASNGLAAAVYTQLSDVETECNGFQTYDRKVLKVDAARVSQANSQHVVLPSGVSLLPNAQQGDYLWRFTTEPPATDWMQPAFDVSGWAERPGGFGTSLTPGAIIGTDWKTSDIWLRRQFVITGMVPPALHLVIHHDENAEVYLNGVLAALLPGFTMHYTVAEITPDALATLHAGRNVIAIHCHQTSGGQFIDAGLFGGTTPTNAAPAGAPPASPAN